MALQILHSDDPVPALDVARLVADLGRRLDGEVRADSLTRGLHATDASFYQIVPAGVVWPRSVDDVLMTLRAAHQAGIAITARGAATSLSGQTHGPGLILDVSRHLDAVLEIDPQRRLARVQPGVILQQLNQQLARHDLLFAPDPATASRATIAGMISNNSSGARSVRWGKTGDHVVALKVALADGTVLELDRCDAPEWTRREQRAGREGELYRGVGGLVERHADAIRERYPRVMRRVAGYALDALLPEREDRSLADLVVGSEGTLAVLLEATLRLVERPRATAVCVVHFDDVVESLRHLPRMLEFRPLAIEMLDDVILTEARRNAATKRHAGFFVGEPKAVQIVELEGATPEDAADRAHELARALRSEGIGTAQAVLTDPEQQADAWATRRLGLGLISNVPGPRKGQPFIEDACVPVEHLARYTERVLEICRGERTPVSIYGHASVGVLHTRPMLDLHSPDEVAKMRRIAEQCFEMVREYGGSWSGEHGDGLVRGEFLPRFFGAEIMDALRQVKEIFDPTGQLNPGKIVDAGPMDQELRYQAPGYAEASSVANQLASFHYRDQLGFALAVEQCNGVGACRKLGSGIMCPSYMATRDEAHSTRGRANALRLAMSGQLGAPAEALASDELHEVLELCLACKGCKSECPNAVDLARLKSDALQMRWRRHGVPLETRLVGALPQLAALAAGPLAPMVNLVQRSKLFRTTVQRWIGLDPSRALPPFARRRLRRQGSASSAVRGNGAVVLYADTYSRYYEPAVAEAAVRLLEQLGHRVEVAAVGDSQRPRISRGLLDAARRDGRRVLERLDRCGDGTAPILCLEPSCASALADDLPDLLEQDAMVERVAQRIMLFDDFLLQSAGAAERLRARSPVVFWHRHCHERSVFDQQIPATLGGARVLDSGAGCCGMAGSFGYQHGALSRKVAEDRLLPALRAALAEHGEQLLVVANGFSCRHQIRDLIDAPVSVLHLSQAVAVGGQGQPAAAD